MFNKIRNFNFQTDKLALIGCRRKILDQFSEFYTTYVTAYYRAVVQLKVLP